MKYVALLSGGKDSCFNLLHCHKNGHELIAAASLRPEQGKEELDSYLYQTVGQDAIEFVARALDVPLYRRVIAGSAVEQGSEYGARTSLDGVHGDETEDLYDLLSTVKSHHPEVQGVSVGAILSNYQRVRVEHVCRRLGLTCLCYLWQRNQEELLSEMIEAGLEAILIKVAGIGLTTKHLGKTLEEMRPTLLKLNQLYGSHICGEGGEYESLTLDCPLFRSRIILEDVETVIHSDNDFATVAFLRIKDAALYPKQESLLFDLHIPPLIDEDHEEVKVAVVRSHNEGTDAIAESRKLQAKKDPTDSCLAHKYNGWFSVTYVQLGCTDNLSLEEEVRGCFKLLKEQLSSFGYGFSHIVNINLFLSSMDFFPQVNAVYSSFFGTSPPARACVAVDLPEDIRIRLDCIAFSQDTESSANKDVRQALHVQSQSYWAPANIGPYSQVGERIFISGQIGLIPSSITLPNPPSLATETALAFQHVDRVVEVLKNSWDGYNQSSIYWLDDVANLNAVRRAAQAYSGDKSAVKMFAAVKALPKGAMIEKQVLYHTGRVWISDVDEGDDGPSEGNLVQKRTKANLKQKTISVGDTEIRYEVSSLEDDANACAIICFKFGESLGEVAEVLKATEDLQKCWSSTLSLRCFYSMNTSSQKLDQVITLLNKLYVVVSPVSSIPCRYLATADEDGWDCILNAIIV
ncbi:meiotically up-regulated 71 protein [Moniliophthora roreri MCA 2997]|uniref:Diphthine--ammonia ligase n=1 Tax=Moniliophthora roreri (strain MCA 2997) TaxID=1381753 RepID=V2XTF9_MONRO|nr:meiotically up-regulated 71 protein [Moniliophthora roreri MCA 2997]